MKKAVQEWRTAPPCGGFVVKHCSFKTLKHITKVYKAAVYTDVRQELNIPVLTPQIRSNSL